MKLQGLQSQSKPVSFGKRIQLGDIKGNYLETNPMAYYLDQFYKAEIPPNQRRLTAEDVVNLHKAIRAHIGVLQSVSGPVDPTLEPAESSYRIEDQATGLPQNIDPAVEQKNMDSEAEVEDRFRIASKASESKDAVEVAELHKRIMATDKSSPEYVDRIIELNEYLAKGMEVEINTENGVLDKVAKSDDATIFLINHYWAPYDIGLGETTVAELYKAYKANGKTDVPEPKYFMNRSISGNLPTKLREAAEKVQATGVAAPSYPTDWSSKYNKGVMGAVIDGFMEDKSNIFIYPEGRRSLYKKDLPLEARFQYGIAKVVQDAVAKKGRVRVISIGTDYHDGLGVSNVGTPIYFEKDGDGIKVTGGNITPDTEAAQNNSFYQRLSTLSEGEGLTICHQGKVVGLQDKRSAKFMSRLIAGILCTDMDISAKRATETLKKFKDVPGTRGIIGRTYWAR